MYVLCPFLLALAVSLTLSSPTGQELKCPKGGKRHTPSSGPAICEACDPGTFMNVSEHSEQACYKCSTCPADHVGRPCNTTSDTVCCPYPDMTVMDTEVGTYCVIPASQHKANHTTTDNNTHQVSECGGTQNTSGSAALDKSNKDIIGLLGHILAVMLCMALHSMFVISPPRRYKLPCIICVVIIATLTFSLIGNDAENMVFLVSVSLSFIYCIVLEIHQTFPSYCNNSICKKTSVCEATKVPVSTRPTSPEADEYIPESQSSDPLITGTNMDNCVPTPVTGTNMDSCVPTPVTGTNMDSCVPTPVTGTNSCVVEPSSQDDPSPSPGGSSNKHDSDHHGPGATADWRSDSRHEPLSAQQTSPPSTEARNWHGASESLLSSETTNGCKFDSIEADNDLSDMSKHSQASVGLPGSGSRIGPETTTLSSSTVDIHRVKVEGSDDNRCAERTELSHDQLALKVRSDTSQ